MLQRLLRAKEAGALNRERQRIDVGPLHLGTDLRAARSARAAGATIDGAQAKSREAWLVYRTNQEVAKSQSKMLRGALHMPSCDAVFDMRVKAESAIWLGRDGEGLER